jgi:chromosomal replication initiator protein
MNNDQLWQAVLGEIELNLSKANFTTWFKNTFISAVENNIIVIGVPNTFTKAWLENKYHKEISNALKNMVELPIKEVIYKVEARKIAPIVNAQRKPEIKKSFDNTESSVPFSTNRFGLNTRYTFENFIVGKGNELAHAAAQAVASNPGHAYNPLFIYGGVGLGKTHLLQAIGQEVSKKSDKILYVSSEKFTNDYIQAVKTGQARDFKERYRNVDLFLIDDIQFMGGKDGTQEEFFHTFNELHQANKQIVITSDRPPKTIPALEKRLLSRFEWGMIADVVQPDHETKIAILQKKCQEKNYILDQDIIQFVSNHIQNNIRELEGALNKIIAYHEFNNTQPNIESVKNILNDLLANVQIKSLSTKDVTEAVCRFYSISMKDLTGDSRKKELVWPRQITMFIMREELNSSYPTIGDELGGRDHTTAMHAYNKILKEVKENENEKIKQEIDSIKQLIYNNTCA